MKSVWLVSHDGPDYKTVLGICTSNEKAIEILKEFAMGDRKSDFYQVTEELWRGQWEFENEWAAIEKVPLDTRVHIS